MANEPSLGQVRDELVAHMEIDKRVRAVEIGQATTSTEVSNLRDEVKSMKSDILAAIESARPKPIWPAVGALAAWMGVLLVLAAAVYGQ